MAEAPPPAAQPASEPVPSAPAVQQQKWVDRWVKNNMPSREQMAESRWLRVFGPFGPRILHSEYWRFTRRSVPRGVALGLFVGTMIPLAHFVVATFLAVFLRANIPAALIATFVGFPVVYVFIVALAYKIGTWLLHVDASTTIQPLTETMEATQTDHLLQQLTGAGLDTAFGLFLIATVLASVGYLATSFLWRWWIGTRSPSSAIATGNTPPATRPATIRIASSSEKLDPTAQTRAASDITIWPPCATDMIRAARFTAVP